MLGYLPQAEKHLPQALISRRCLLEWEEVLPNFLMRPKKKERKKNKQQQKTKQINNNNNNQKGV